jgi:hypothetical protein
MFMPGLRAPDSSPGRDVKVPQAGRKIIMDRSMNFLTIQSFCMDNYLK